MKDLAYLRAARFSYVRQIGSVWFDDPHDVPSLHGSVRSGILSRVREASSGAETPLGVVVKGDPGMGKTHLLGELRRVSWQEGLTFLYVDMTDVNDFARTLLLGLSESLQKIGSDGRMQLRHALGALFSEAERAAGRTPPSDGGLGFSDDCSRCEPAVLLKKINELVNDLWRRHRHDMRGSAVDVVRALMGLNSDDFDVASLATAWLQGATIEDFDGQRLALKKCNPLQWEIVKGIFWALRFRGPTLLCFDQLDACFPHLDAARSAPDMEEGRTSKIILSGVGMGLGSLRDSLNSSTLAVVACFHETWEILKQNVPISFTDRFREPFHLTPPGDVRIPEGVVERRLHKFPTDFAPPYPTWPFTSEFFASVSRLSPREILRRCERHRDECLERGAVRELHRFDENPFEKISVIPVGDEFKELLSVRMRAMQPEQYLEDSDDAENALGALLADCCALLRCERDVSPNEILESETASGGHNGRPAIHARLKRIVSSLGKVDEEWHACVRALLRNNAVAYNHRLHAAMTESGIDRRLSRRRLVIARNSEPLRSGKVGKKHTEDFEGAGGIFVNVSPDDVRTMRALLALRQETLLDADSAKEARFVSWLHRERPFSCMPVFREMLVAWGEAQHDPSGEKGGEVSETVFAAPTESSSDPRVREVGRVLSLGDASRGDRANVAIDDLPRHAVVFAGSGSGKTVLLKRIVEEAALHGIPSIVLDGANDLALLGDSWPEVPTGWDEGDAAKAFRLFNAAETLIWTPGKISGRPLSLPVLPDFSGVRDDPDDFASTLAMALDALSGLAVVGSGAKTKRMRGVLSAALSAFGRAEEGGLDDFLRYLRALPSDVAGDITSASALAREVADNIQSSILTNPLLSGIGTPLSPEELLGTSGASGRTRISVVNMIGLPSEAARQTFVGQLAMSLFAWARKNPPTGTKHGINGLLVVDEAKDFVPAVRTTPCKQSLLRLAAQGRKYGLGLILATQSPKDLDYTALSNVSTWFFGRANSPQAIAQIADALAERGGNGKGVATLARGEFHFVSPSSPTPHLVHVPLCLSHHPDRQPLSEMEVLDRARRSRPVAAGGTTNGS